MWKLHLVLNGEFMNSAEKYVMYGDNNKTNCRNLCKLILKITEKNQKKEHLVQKKSLKTELIPY